MTNMEEETSPCMEVEKQGKLHVVAQASQGCVWVGGARRSLEL